MSQSQVNRRDDVYAQMLDKRMAVECRTPPKKVTAKGGGLIHPPFWVQV